MIISRHSKFKKSYQNRIARNPKLVIQTKEKIYLFMTNPKNPILKDHALVGKKKQYRAFWITGDIRIVYFPTSNDEVIFFDIGSHNQVY